jgi:antitoxin HicB
MKMIEDLKYPVNIRHLSKSEGGGYLVEFPDLPGCIADGDTIEEALKAAEDAMNSWLMTAGEFNDELPSPEQYSGQWRMRVPKSLHAALARRAKSEGVSLNALASVILAEGVSHNLFGHELKNLAAQKKTLKTQKHPTKGHD